jgi:hypothetical protein
MGSYIGLEILRPRITRGILALGIIASGGTGWAQGWQLADKLTLKTDLTLKETYDDNVYILNSRPNPGVTPPPGITVSVPYKDSLVTTVIPGLALGYRPCEQFAATVSYAPEFTWYESAHSEDYVANRGAINFSGKIDEVSYEWLNGVTWIDGSDQTYITIRPGDCRAIGGIPLRDRRDAAIYRDSLRVTIPEGKWFFRPVVTAYVHDFQTKQLPNTNSSQYIYDNFVDRWDIGGGLDIGYEAFAQTKLVVGYRYGHQEQGKLLGNESPYSNDYQRFLVGIEGTPVSWLKLAVLGGPDLRHWCSSTPAGFDRDEIVYWIDGTLILLPTQTDTMTLRVTYYEQPAFTSQSMYEDIKYDVTWRHKFTDKFTAGAGFTFYIGDWQAPVNREDWILTPSLMASYAFNAHLTAELAWSYDWASSQVPDSPNAPYADGRNYRRNLVSLALKYAF